MPGLTLYTGNRLEVLAQELAARLRYAGDPLKPDIIIVQSRGMERWLSLAIAQYNGIVANCQFPFPNTFLEAVFSRLFSFDPQANPYKRRVITFKIMRVLPDLVMHHSAFDDFRVYLADDRQGVKSFQLAAEIADLMDQYLIFRPQMLLDWEKRPQTDTSSPFAWQPVLWRELTRDVRAPHRAALWKALMTPHASIEWSGAGLPERVSLFGVSYLPPYYLQVLQALSAGVSIDVYQLNPCREFWADIVSDREIARRLRQMPSADPLFDPNSMHLETGNRLLASMGGHGREFHTLVAELDCPVEERFHDFAPKSLLQTVQHDLLHLINHEGSPAVAAEHQTDPVPHDPSIQVHACHGPMREIEVLHNQLLALFEIYPAIAPRDILVMTPDIERYAPYIQAVFGSPPDERLNLPFSIADRCLASASPLVETFNLLLDLRTARFTRSEILALLEFGPLREQFGFVEADLPLIADLTERVRIRWGIDGAAKKAWNLPLDDANTWRRGLDRLVMGYALHAEPDRLFQNLLPDDGYPGHHAAIVGQLTDFLESLWAFSRDLDAPRQVHRWHARLTDALATFFVRDAHYEYDFQTLERLLGDIQHDSVVAGFDALVDLDVVRADLNRRLSQENYHGGFIAGGITFGALLPMRSIPAAVICLVGLNHDCFPRLDRPRNFDLMALDARLGDRSRRSDDRYLFLEALISARQCFYISYTGFDLHDNAVRPPSVLVSELLDYLQENHGLKENDLVVSHRLQAFSPAYFKGQDARLFSYNRDQARAARCLDTPGKIPPDAVAFLRCALEKAPDPFLTLTPEDLLEALVHPCRFLLERRMALRLRPLDRLDTDRETFELAAREQFQEGQWLASQILAGTSVAKVPALQQARGILPHSEAGQSISRQLIDAVEAFSDQVRPYIDQPALPSRLVEIQLDGFQICGRLDDLYPEGLVLFRFSKANGRALLNAWIQHLLICHLADGDPHKGSTVLICRDEVRRFHFVEDAVTLFHPLLDLYFQAVHLPLAIFPRATPAFARQRFEKGNSGEKARKAARRAWEGDLKVTGDRKDPYIALGFRGRNPWDDDQGFEEIAAQLFAPVFNYSETIAGVVP